MKQVANPKGSTVADFVESYNEICAELSRATIERVQYVSDREALIFYDDPDPKPIEKEKTEYEADYCIQFADPEEEETATITMELVLPVPDKRYCCECDNYDWGRGCQYRHGRIRFMDHACVMFNINIGGAR